LNSFLVHLNNTCYFMCCYLKPHKNVRWCNCLDKWTD